jgi:hypothetical protein
MARSWLLRSQQARRAEETSTLQEDVDTLRGPEQSDDGLADDVRIALILAGSRMGSWSPHRERWGHALVKWVLGPCVWRSVCAMTTRMRCLGRPTTAAHRATVCVSGAPPCRRLVHGGVTRAVDPASGPVPGTPSHAEDDAAAAGLVVEGSRPVPSWRGSGRPRAPMTARHLPASRLCASVAPAAGTTWRAGNTARGEACHHMGRRRRCGARARRLRHGEPPCSTRGGFQERPCNG